MCFSGCFSIVYSINWFWIYIDFVRFCVFLLYWFIERVLYKINSISIHFHAVLGFRCSSSWIKSRVLTAAKAAERRHVSVVIVALHCIISSTWLNDYSCVSLCICLVFECDSLTDWSVVVFQLVFEALHSQEPRGYVVGWIIAISLLVGILIFLLLAVLLWKVTNTPTQIVIF